jgi:hypothetical protein
LKTLSVEELYLSTFLIEKDKQEKIRLRLLNL